MNDQPKPSSPPAEPALSESDYNQLIFDFQAHLHTVVTAYQMGQSGQLAALPGPGMREYCHALAKVHGGLAWELEKPVGVARSKAGR